MATGQELREPDVARENGHSTPQDKAPEQPTAEAVREQLERLLHSPRFVSSPRCQHLLRYVVEESLLGHPASLKERSLGFEVFKRDVAYDTNADPVVRVAAGEIRKKLALYYYEPENQDQVRIELPTGSYTPQFSLPAAGGAKEGALHPWSEAQSQNSGARASATAEAILSPAATSWSRKKRVQWALAALAAGLVACCVAAFAWRAAHQASPLDTFWAPIIKSPDPALICIGQLSAGNVQLNPDPARNSLASMPIEWDGVHPQTMAVATMNDAIVAADVAGLLRLETKPFKILAEGKTTYDDLQRSPAVLVGALDNDWTIYFTRGFRFSFNEDPLKLERWVTDQQKPGSRIGLVDFGNRHSHTGDAAIVARIVDSDTKQPVIIVAGVTAAATLAAGEFVTNPEYLGAFLKTAPSNWQTSNLEILLTINVISDHPGPPRVAATAVWKRAE